MHVPQREQGSRCLSGSAANMLPSLMTCRAPAGMTDTPVGTTMDRDVSVTSLTAPERLRYPGTSHSPRTPRGLPLVSTGSKWREEPVAPSAATMLQVSRRQHGSGIRRMTGLSLFFSRSVVFDSAIPWTAAHQASLSITNSRSLLKLSPSRQ